MIHRFVDLQGGIFPYAKDIFNSGTSDEYSQIWAVATAGGGPYAVTTHTTNGTIDTDPHVSPDGSMIVFLRATGFGSPKLWIVNSDGTGLTQIDSNTGCNAPMWHPDGSKILYRRGNGFRTIEPSGANNTAITITGPTGDVGLKHPTYNRDGTLIAFHDDFSAGGTPDALWVCNADGSSAAKLSDATQGGLGGFGISWAHGTDTIAFVERISGTNHVSTIEADGTGKTQITSTGISPGPSRFAWSPDDVDVFTGRQVTPWSLYRVPASGSGESAVSPTLALFQVVGRGQGFVHTNGRIYTIRRTTGDLVSILPDGSDLRVEDTPTNGPTFFDSLSITGNGTEL